MGLSHTELWGRPQQIQIPDLTVLSAPRPGPRYQCKNSHWLPPAHTPPGTSPAWRMDRLRQRHFSLQPAQSGDQSSSWPTSSAAVTAREQGKFMAGERACPQLSSLGLGLEILQGLHLPNPRSRPILQARRPPVAPGPCHTIPQAPPRGAQVGSPPAVLLCHLRSSPPQGLHVNSQRRPAPNKRPRQVEAKARPSLALPD